jgi:hypothetical protein
MSSIPPGWIRQLDGSYSPPSRLAKSVNPGFNVGTSELSTSDTLPINKYNVSSVLARTFSGIVFDSKLEMKAFQLLTTRGIKFDFHPLLELQPGFKHGGDTYAPITYEGDFRLYPTDGPIIVDMKGMVLPVFLIKEKMVLYQYKMKILCVKNISEFSRLLAEHGLSR